MIPYERPSIFPRNKSVVLGAVAVLVTAGVPAFTQEQNNADSIMPSDRRISYQEAGALLLKAAVYEHAYLLGSAGSWHEAGRGDLIDIDRRQYSAGAGLPLSGRGHIEVLGHRWEEMPGGTTSSFDASGVSVSGRGIIKPWLKTSAGFTFKGYTDSRIEDTETGHIECEANIRDILVLNLRRDRVDELYNRRGIDQGVHSDSWEIRGSSSITPDIEVSVSGRGTEYSDDNHGERAHANFAYSLADHPRALKVAVFGEIRDTDEKTYYSCACDSCGDITHPYWTPENYGAWGMALRWHHDMSPVLSRGTDQRSYDLQIALRDDTQENPTFEFNGNVHWEFQKGWLVGLDAMIVRSEQWDGEGFRFAVGRLF